jgi:hypothetical protein
MAARLEAVFFRRRMNSQVAAARIAIPATPPTTPPAIAATLLGGVDGDGSGSWESCLLISELLDRPGGFQTYLLTGRLRVVAVLRPRSTRPCQGSFVC